MTARTSRLPDYGRDLNYIYDQNRPRSLSRQEIASQFFKAIISGELSTVYSLLDRHKVHPNDPIEGHTFMHVAAGVRSKDRSSSWILEKLLKSGGNPNLVVDGRTPVHIACIWDNEPNLRILIERGGDVDLTDNKGKNALALARKYSQNCAAVVEDFMDKRDRKTDRRNSGGLYPSLVDELPSRSFSRQTSASSVASEYHSCVDRSSPPPRVPDVPLYEYQQRRSVRSTSKTRCSSGDRVVNFEEPIRHLSPPTPKKVSTRRSASGSRNVPSASRSRDCSTSDDETQQFFSSRGNSRTRYSDEKRKRGLEMFDPNNCQRAKEYLDQEYVRFGKSTTNTEPKMTRHRRTSGKENEAPQAEIEVTNYGAMTDAELRRELLRLGENVGPFETGYERAAYLRRLIKLKKEESNGCIDRTSMKEMAFCRELDQVADNHYDDAYLQNFESLLSASFRVSSVKKMSFVYLLLDPQISKNLPHMLRLAKEPNISLFFKLFLRAIFYVGKASTHNRPESHLMDAKRVYRTTQIQKASQKVRRICSIWDDDHGVVLFPLQPTLMSEQEAFTREALMIDVLGIGKNGKLTNERRGTVYGEVAKWSPSQQRLLASYLLRKAFNFYMGGTEDQIFPDQIGARDL